MTKARGAAHQGFYDDEGAAAGGSTAAGGPEGTQFLSSRPPWVCSICNVTCTSQETLLGHAAGAKHKRRVGDLAGPAAGCEPLPALTFCWL